MGVVLLLAMIYVAYKVAGSLKRESAVIAEFYGPSHLRTLVILYPVAAILTTVRGFIAPALLAVLFAFAFYVVAYIAARGQRIALERSGTDRTREAISTTSTAGVWAAIGAVVCMVLLAYDGYAFYMLQPVRFE